MSLTTGSQYTNNFTITLSAAGVLTVSDNLYDNSGNLLSSETNTAGGTTNLTQSFDGLALGTFNSGTSLDPVMDIGQIKLPKASSASRA